MRNDLSEAYGQLPGTPGASPVHGPLVIIVLRSVYELWLCQFYRKSNIQVQLLILKEIPKISGTRNCFDHTSFITMYYIDNFGGENVQHEEKLSEPPEQERRFKIR